MGTPIKLGTTVSPPGEFNVKSYGAIGDGSNDDTTAIQATLTALSSTAGVVYFPPGTYKLTGNGILLNLPSGSTLRGQGMNRSVLKAFSGIGNYISQSGGTVLNITIEDLTFDGNSISGGGVQLYGSSNQNITFRRCRFIGMPRCISLTGAKNITIEDCEFFGGARANTSGIVMSGGVCNIKILRNLFHYIIDAVSVDTGSTDHQIDDLADWLIVEGNEFKNQWWTWPTLASNSGDTVTYIFNEWGSHTIIDTAGIDTSGLPIYKTLRILEVRRTGTVQGNYTRSMTTLEDTAATFISSGTQRCEIIRSGNKFTTVTGVQSETKLRIDGWVDSTTYLPTAPPLPNDSYVLYKTFTARCGAKDSTSISTYEPIYDFNGTYTLPANGSLYEIYQSNSYLLHIEYSGRNVRINNNTFRGGWSDQCSVYCNRAQISNNTIEDGQDVGITLNGTIGDGHSLVSNNRINHQGTWPIFLSGAHTTIIGNVCTGNGWTNHVNPAEIGAIAVQWSVDSQVIGNYIDGENLPYSKSGIALRQTSGCTVADNTCKNHTLGGITLYNDIPGDNNSNVRLRNNRASLYFGRGSSGTAPMPEGGDFGVLLHDDLGIVGSPEGVLIAGIGTTFVSSTGIIYSKKSGVGTTGWRIVNTIESASSVPVSGIWAIGDISYNSSPEAGGNLGWVCTVAGGYGGAWQNTHNYFRDQLCNNDSGKIYLCITSGQSASAGGPIGTSSDITDGAAHWKYLYAGAPTFKTFGGEEITLAAVGSTPSANGMSVASTGGTAISGQTLTLQPADATNPGVVNTSAQTLGAGIKTFSDSISLPNTSGKGVLINGNYSWKDILGDVSPKTTGAGAATLAVFRGGTYRAWFYQVNDICDIMFHMPHNYAPGTDIYLHLHWAHNGTAISGSFVTTFGVSYAKGRGQEIFTAEVAPVITVSTPDIATIPQYSHRIDEIQLSATSPSGTQLDTTHLEPDGIILVGLKVTTIPTITGGSTNLPALITCDLHYQSTGVGTKNKANNFYT